MFKHVIVSGIVQGVGFRFSTKQAADARDLKGWVQNNADGTVEMEIEGQDQSLMHFMDKLKAGFTPAIQVDSVDENTQSTLKGYTNFVIK